MGAQTTFTQEAADEIVERLSDGEPLAQICRDDHMPGYRTVYDWRDADAAFAANIARAREIGEEAIVARGRLTVRGKTPDQGGDSSGDVQRDKLIVEYDLKLLAKWNPKKWGDRQQVAPVTPDGEALQMAPILFQAVAAKPRADDE